MSFASELKKTLCAVENRACCLHAAVYAIFLYGYRFDAHAVTFQTESSAVAQTAAAWLAMDAGIFADVRTPLRRGRGCVSSVVAGEGQCPAVLAHFGHAESDERRVQFSNLTEPCCAGAFLRGAFLACGTVNDPERGYHLELDAPNAMLADALGLLLQSQFSLYPGRSERKGASVIYFKNAEDIATLLEILGAPDSAAQVRAVRLMKERRGDANRRTNFDTANIDKTVSAATAQIDAILRLKKRPDYGALPEELRELAEVRLMHPEYSLRELGDALSVPVSRSGVNHRLARLLALADEK